MPRELSLPIRHLAEFLYRTGSIDSRGSGFNRAQQGSRIHRMLQKQAKAGYEAEISLAFEYQDDDILYHLVGRADGIFLQDETTCIDEIKTVAHPVADMDENAHPEHWAQGKIYAYILANQRNLPAVGVQLTYYNIDTDEVRRILHHFTAQQLTAFMQKTMAAYRRWAVLTLERQSTRNQSLQQLPFPFAEYRAGQRSMAVGAYNTFQQGGQLFCCAPTGIGKTISTLFPAMKALGEGYGERIFYLTAKTITRTAAEDTLALLAANSPAPLQFNSVTITAKDKICFLEERNCTPSACEWAEGYYSRVNDAVYEILQQSHVYTRETIESFAKKYRLCPYELALDLSNWCDCIIGDYNYLFDPVVYLQRYFEGKGGDYIFLIDEAHNLPDRSREMYSASVSKTPFFEFSKQLPTQHSRLRKALTALNKAFIALRHQCEAAGENPLTQADPPSALNRPLEQFLSAAEIFLEEHRGSEHEAALLPLYFNALFYSRMLERYDTTYTTLLYRYGNNVTAKLYCLDPAPAVDACLSKGRAAVLFSATLEPLRYYRETLGNHEQAKLLALQSPFAADNLGLYVADGISTKYAQRSQSLPAVCEMLHAMVQAKQGNYIAYFPSYSYMQTAYEHFIATHPHIPTLLQTSGMSELQREDFLQSFTTANTQSLLGFCVLGGIFSEGVDLAGDSLIGCAIVGVGLPQIGPEPDALRAYYNQKNGCGFEFAYQFPGMNKVLQAAGRVIRSEQDKGVVLLIDSRFTTSRYQSLFPPHWQHWQQTNAARLPNQLAAFWQNNTKQSSPASRK